MDFSVKESIGLDEEAGLPLRLSVPFPQFDVLALQPNTNIMLIPHQELKIVPEDTDFLPVIEEKEEHP